jgi:hypothetical protein
VILSTKQAVYSLLSLIVKIGDENRENIRGLIWPNIPVLSLVFLLTMVVVGGRMKRPIFMYKRVLLSDPEIKLLSEILRQNLVEKSELIESNRINVSLILNTLIRYKSNVLV